MKDDFEQLEKGYILMLRLKDEEITRLKGMISESVRHGHWEKIGTIENTWLVYKCSICGYQTIDNGNYCPNCGAKMIPTIPKEIIDAVLGEDEVNE